MGRLKTSRYIRMNFKGMRLSERRSTLYPLSHNRPTQYEFVNALTEVVEWSPGIVGFCSSWY